MKKYSTHLLCYGKGADLVYSGGQSTVLPGTPFTCHDRAENDILLAGGFPSIHPETPFPLSPTLQLNGDLAGCDADALASIGRAELARANSQSYRSYSLEPDRRVTVLGVDGKQLHAFVGRYGGVLDIDPLLLQGYDPELVTSEELSLQRTKSGFLIRFLVRQPFDPERCTYCGNCVQPCPEQCLSEKLFIDFSRCSLCNKCVDTCPHDALDLHGAEQRELHTPAVLLLQDTGIELSGESGPIFHEDNLTDLFSSIYAALVEEVVSWNGNCCQYSPKHDLGCKICFTVCNHNAISAGSSGITIDHHKCRECGDCISACPSGAIQYERFDDRDFIEYFREVTLPERATVVIGNEEGLHRFWWQASGSRFEDCFFLEHPQPHCLSSMHFFFLLAMGVAGIVLLDGDEDGHSAEQVQLVNEVADLSGNGMPAVVTAGIETLSDILETPVTPNRLPSRYRDFSFAGRRQKLADLLYFFGRNSTLPPVLLTGGAAASFGEVICNQIQCTLCAACLGECRVAALTADSSTYRLQFTPVLCVQCNVCVDLCPENALTLQAGLSLLPSFFKTTTLARAEPVRCRQCGKPFGTRQSLDKVMALLSRNNMLDRDDDLLSHCETCRVLQLFESPPP